MCAYLFLDRLNHMVKKTNKQKKVTYKGERKQGGKDRDRN